MTFKDMSAKRTKLLKYAVYTETEMIFSLNDFNHMSAERAKLLKHAVHRETEMIFSLNDF